MSLAVHLRRRSSRRISIIRAAALSSALALTTAASAADLYWDADAANAGGSTGTGAAGTWGVSNFWNTDSGGAAPGSFSTTVGAGNTAVFAAGTDVSGTYTVTVSGSQTADGITFEEGTVTLSGGTIILNGGTPTLIVGTGTANRNVTINSALDAASELRLQKGTTGTGTLSFGAANTLNAANALRIGGGLRINANVAGSLGTGIITIDGTETAISNNTDTSNITYSNNIVLNPLNTAGFVVGLVGAGNSGTVANFSGNISGNADVMISPTPVSANTNGSGLTIFSGNNSYTGRTIVNNATAGTFRIGSTTALPTTTSLVFGKAGTTAGQNVGGADLNGFDINVVSIATEQPSGNTVQGITNSNGGAGGNIAVTGGLTTTFNGLIGAFSNSSLTTAGTPGTNNLSLTLSAAHTGSLTLTRQNTYTGATTVSGGTLVLANTTAAQNTVAGAVTVDNTGVLATAAGTQATTAGVGGLLTVNNGGVVSPGGTGIGTLAANGGMTVNTGGNFDFDLVSLTNYDQINLGVNALTLDSGSHTVEVSGTVVAGTYNLMNYGSLISDNVNLFTLGSNPGGAFSYQLNTGANALTLTVTPTVQSLVWDIGGGGSPIVEGAGTWADGSTDFTDISTNAGTTFSNGGTADVAFGADAAGSGGAITLGGNVRTGAMLIFGPINDASAPYSIEGNGNTLTTVGGITANASATLNAPVVLEASQTWNIALGKTLTASGDISDGSGGPKAITKNGAGVLRLLGASNTFSGGLSIVGGTVEANSDGAIGTGDVTLDNNSTFRFTAAYATDNNFVVNAAGGRISADTGSDSSISGTISGAGKLTKVGSGTILLTGANTFNGLFVDAGTIAVNADSGLGAGDIELAVANLAAATSGWSTAKNITLIGASNPNDIFTNGFDVTLSGVISGDGDLRKKDAGVLTLSGANTYSGQTIFPASGGGGTIRTTTVNAMGTGNLQAFANGTVETVNDLAVNAVRASATLTKTGAGTLSVSGSTAGSSTGGTILVAQGAVRMNSRDGLGGVNSATTSSSSTQLNITLNAGTELQVNWGAGTERRGGSITLNDATIRRLASAPDNNESEFHAYNGATYWGNVLTVSGNSKIDNESVSNGTDNSANLAFSMPVVLQAGATLTMENDNNTGDYDAYITGFRGTNNTTHSAYDILTMNDGSSIVMSGPGEKRIGGNNTGKPIVVNGNATLKLDSRSFMTDIDGSGTGNEFTKLTINGGSLRIEAPMNASYTTPIDPQPTLQPEEGFTGFFGINTTSSMEGGTPPANYSNIGNAYTVMSPKRANGLAGSTGTITLAATDSTSATGRLEYGPTTPSSVRLAVDNTSASAGANLTYEIDPAADSGTANNFAGLDTRRSSSGAGSVKAKIVNGALKLPDVTISGGSQIDVNDQKLIVQSMPLGTWDGAAYTGVHGLVQAGRGDGSWNGSGLVTSQTDATTGVLTTLATASGAEIRGLGPTDTDVFAGHTINGDSVVVMYTWGGDADLNGELNGDDYFFIDSNVINSGLVFGFHQGDFDYNGEINGDDYFIIDSNITFAQASGFIFPTGAGGGAGGLAAVPEPGAISILALAGAGLLRRRRRH